MKLEAITVCVNYADFLIETARYNAHLFDRWIVVTDHADAATKHVCRKFGLQCLVSDDAYRDNHDFNKGRLIERGLHHTSADAWRIHIDADIVLPAKFRQYLDHAHIQENTLYGVDRILVKSWEDWQKLQATNWLYGLSRPYPYCIDFPHGFAVGSRWGSPETGWAPIGFFQMWHSSVDEWCGVRTKHYPQTHGTACRADVQHSLQFDRKDRALIPEIIVAHLESEACPKGTNWKGRKSKQFGPGVFRSNHALGRDPS